MEKLTSRLTFPYVTVEQAVAYNPDRPETATDSRIVNAVVEAFLTVRPLTPRTIADFVGVANLDLAGAMKCATGLSLVKFLDEWRVQKILGLSDQEKMQSSDDIAHLLGFYDRSSLWEFMKRRRLLKKIKSGALHDLAIYENPVFVTKKKHRYHGHNTTQDTPPLQ